MKFKYKDFGIFHAFEDWADTAQKWLAENAPGSETFVLGKHAMLWEFPVEFNMAVDSFLLGNK